MSPHRDRDLEDLLRHALRERAEQITPRDDGLLRIHDQIARSRRSARADRHRQGRRLRPVLTAAAVAAAVAAVVALPVVLHDQGRPSNRELAASQSHPQASASEGGSAMSGLGASAATAPLASASAAPSALSGPPANSASAPPTPGPDTAPSGRAAPPLTPEATRDTVDASGLTAWPYLSEDAAIKHVKTDGRMRDPARLATEFVAQFVPADSLTADKVTKGAGAELVVALNRTDTDTLVCVVHLVPVSGAPSSYLVKDATAPGLTIQAPRAVSEAKTVPLDGKFAVTSRPAARIWAGVGAPDPDGRITPSDNSTVAPDRNAAWELTVSPTPLIANGGVVAAWSVDASGQVLEFTARPAR